MLYGISSGFTAESIVYAKRDYEEKSLLGISFISLSKYKNNIKAKDKLENVFIIFVFLSMLFEYPYKLMLHIIVKSGLYFAIIGNSLIHCLAVMGLTSVMCLKYLSMISSIL